MQVPYRTADQELEDSPKDLQYNPALEKALMERMGAKPRPDPLGLGMDIQLKRNRNLDSPLLRALMKALYRGAVE